MSGPGISVHLGGVLAAADDESSLPFALLLHSITRTIHWKELEFDGGFALAIFHDGVLTTLQSYENSRVEVFTSMSILPRALANSSTSALCRSTGVSPMGWLFNGPDSLALAAWPEHNCSSMR